MLLLRALGGLHLLRSVSSASEADLYPNGPRHEPVEVVAERWRSLEAQRCQGKTPQPLLWRAKTPNRTMYLVATYNVTQLTMEPLFEQVERALGCADVAYFELACSQGFHSDISNYTAHCHSYSTMDPKDSIASRIMPQDLRQLQAAAETLADSAPAECHGPADGLRRAARVLNETSNWTTLLAFHHQALQTLSPSACTRQRGAELYEDRLRAVFGEVKPIFGLRDVSTQCAVYRSNQVSEDQVLAKRMIKGFSSAGWRANATRNQEEMDDLMHCGDLGRLAAMHDAVADLPWLGDTRVGQRNPVIVKGIRRALEEQPGRTILAAINVARFLDLPDAPSVPSLLQTEGFTFERLTPESSMDCPKSTYAAQGAKQLGMCLMPPRRSQDGACNRFTEAFAAALGQKDSLYGRTEDNSNCKECVKSAKGCSCTIAWRNDTRFKELCLKTSVDGPNGKVTGQVMVMDLTRNPGSLRTGPAFAEKNVRSVFQNCYAASCKVPLEQEMLLRNWYKTDTSLAGGLVQLRDPSQPPRSVGRSAALGAAPVGKGHAAGWSALGSSWPWWSWALLALLLALCVGGLLKCFLTPKKKKRTKRGMLMGEAQFPAARTQNSFQKLPSHGGGYEDRPPSPHRAEQAWQAQAQAQGHAAAAERQVSVPPPMSAWEAQGQGHGQAAGWGASARETEAQQGWMQPPQMPFPTRGPSAGYEQSTGLQMTDNSILSQAIQMQQILGDAGAQAVQQMQMQALQNWQVAAHPGAQQVQSPLPTSPHSPFPTSPPQLLGSAGQMPGSPAVQHRVLYAGQQQGAPSLYSPLPQTGPVPSMPYAYPRMA